MKSKKTIKAKISVVVKNIEVENGWYGFDYVTNIGGKIKKEHYESDYSEWTEKGWMEQLKNYYAVKQAIEDSI